MSAAEYLGMYAEGWTNGDVDTIIKSVSDDFFLDDPNSGMISKGEFSGYFHGLKDTINSLIEGPQPETFLDLSEIVTQEDGGVITAWAWWVFPGTEVKGSGLIKAGPDGIRSEVLTYYTKLSD